jgi:hypothetical protein
MNSERQISKKEIRESEIRMTGRAPTTSGFIGFVPARPDGQVAETEADLNHSPPFSPEKI